MILEILGIFLIVLLGTVVVALAAHTYTLVWEEIRDSWKQ